MRGKPILSLTLLSAALLAGCSGNTSQGTTATDATDATSVPSSPVLHPGTTLLSQQKLPRWNNLVTKPDEVMVPASGLTLNMGAGLHSFGLAGNIQTPVWGYALPGKSGDYLGPTLRAEKDIPVPISYRNNLPSQLPFALDTVTSPRPPMTDPQGYAIPHLHGGHSDPASDGLPEQGYPNGGTIRTMTYRNDQPGTNLWYHDHAMGLTRTNVYAGLAGMYLLHDPLETQFGLPWADAYDVPLILQDKAFNKDGSLLYPAQWVPEFFGDAAVINGKVFPVMNIEPRKYRFRLLNASNARFYDLKLLAGSKAVAFQQIGSDGGLLPQAVTMPHLVIAPGERMDVIVDFSAFAGRTLQLANQAGTPYGGGVDPRGGTPSLPSLMQFMVGSTVSRKDQMNLPTSLAPLPALSAADVQKVRYLTLDEVLNPATGTPQRMLLGTLNMQTGASNMHAYHDLVTETPTVNTVEEWVFINNTVDAHPIHVHQTQFMVLGRARVTRVPGTANLAVGNPGNVKLSNGQPQFNTPRPPELNELGWKDTLIVYPGEMARIRLKFDITGRYIWHCHILEHEENDMMRPIQVLAVGETAPTAQSQFPVNMTQAMTR